MAFTPDWIYEAEGVKVFRDARSKTDVGFFSVLLPEAEEILKKYYGSLPRYSNQKYNDYLKLIAIACGIKKHLTTHVARHTFATYLLNRDVPIETVSKAVGHTSIKQTQHYAKLLGKKERLYQGYEEAIVTFTIRNGRGIKIKQRSPSTLLQFNSYE